MSISRKRMKEINSIKEKDIDYSDIPELDKEFWDNVKPVYPKGRCRGFVYRNKSCGR